MGPVDTTPGPDPGDAVPDGGTYEDPGPEEPIGFQGWMKRSASGAILSGIALGLQQALEPKRELPAFVMEAPGEPEDPDAAITLRFDPDDPTKTVAVVRSPAKGTRQDPVPGDSRATGR